ncbi:branched-chain amino acid transport system substrate-binding protein [Ancylobacter sp. 3268]|uniref:ABC transporter substrate-binding protein n=1 Tax=Ancylobacter sp. 3268 TaxID=2817752 RepID=UPI00285F6FBD|nr:ABC transporter substrate-binding protein [Ancylobacter sp. 3268]MDR6954038.1 branched-chain amino acid transport system substrate-binding protein [Ancylobacter sp. 3268]
MPAAHRPPLLARLAAGIASLLAAPSLAGLLLAGLAATAPARAAEPIRIGELNSYKAQPAFLEPYRKGMELAIDQINAAGGIGGRPLELITRDDGGNPGDAVRVAEDLVTREKVDVLTGTFLSNVGLAVAGFADKRKVFFLASEPLTDKITWAEGNRYTFRLRASTYMQVAMLMPHAVKADKKRWALVYPNYEYGQSAAATFKTLLKAAQPDVEFVAEQATPFGKLDAGAVAQALADARPDAVFNVLFAADLAKFVREANSRGTLDGTFVVSLLSGEPEYLDPMKDEAPQGWVATGYPWYAIGTPEHKAFLDAYQAKYGEPPRLGSVVGYTAILSLGEGLKKAGGAETEKLVEAFKGLPVTGPFGPFTYRASDHQATMGAFVGTLGLKDGKGVMLEPVYVDGASVLPSDAEVEKLRPRRD